MGHHTHHPPVLVVMLDGIGDRTWPILDNLSPLSAAATPNLDAVARTSATGILHTLGPGRAPGTELAHFTLLGYPLDLYPGRAVLEAAGASVPVTPDQVVMHALFVTVRRTTGGSLTILERYPRGTGSDVAKMVGLLSGFEHNGLRVDLAHTGGNEAILTLEPCAGSDRTASEHITDTDPHNNGWPVGSVQALDNAIDPQAAEATATALTRFLEHAYSSLRDLGQSDEPDVTPFLLLKWTSRARPLPAFKDRTGMRGTIVSSTRILAGLCDVLDMTHRRVDPLPDLVDDTISRMSTAAEALGAGFDFALVHMKEPDVAGHSKDPVAKRDVIEAIDAGLEGLAQRQVAGSPLPQDTVVVVTGDHGTPSGTTLIHSGDPVPFALLSDGVNADDARTFDEQACAAGALGRLLGSDVMPIILNARGTTRYLGGRLARHTGLHWAEDYEPFRVD